MCFLDICEAMPLLNIMRKVWLLTNDIFYIFLGIFTSISFFITFQILRPMTVTPWNFMLYICKSSCSKVWSLFIWLKCIDSSRDLEYVSLGLFILCFLWIELRSQTLSCGQPQKLSQVFAIINPRITQE